MPFFYSAAMLSAHPEQLKTHPLSVELDIANVIMESSLFTNYNQCISAIQLLVNDYMAILKAENPTKEYAIAWELNPNHQQTVNTITPKEKWSDNELLKLYVVEQTAEPIKMSTFKPFLAAAVNLTTDDTTDLH
jgi:hypothetical protein